MPVDAVGVISIMNVTGHGAARRGCWMRWWCSDMNAASSTGDAMVDLSWSAVRDAARAVAPGWRVGCRPAVMDGWAFHGVDNRWPAGVHSGWHGVV
jgi:hypothetical protein